MGKLGQIYFYGAALAVLGACQSVGGGAYVGRGEFEALTRRVEEVEARAGLPSQAGGLPALVSASSRETGLNNEADLAPSGLPVASSLASLKPPPGTRTSADRPPYSTTTYQEGQNLLKARKYVQAAGVFNRLLTENPGGRLAPNARYWLGECFYAQGRFSEAAAEFRRCAADYAQSEKAADSLLKLSFCYDRLGDGPQAMAALDQLLRLYPGSHAAGLVRNGPGYFRG